LCLWHKVCRLWKGMVNDMTKKQKKSWFKGLKAEFSKIIWPDQKSLTKETIAVLVVSVLLGVIISVVDLIVRFGIEFIVK
jgi:preprotein translocase subunit SecE